MPPRILSNQRAWINGREVELENNLCALCGLGGTTLSRFPAKLSKAIKEIDGCNKQNDTCHLCWMPRLILSTRQTTACTWGRFVNELENIFVPSCGLRGKTLWAKTKKPRWEASWVAKGRFELPTFGLWARRATTALLRDLSCKDKLAVPPDKT